MTIFVIFIFYQTEMELTTVGTCELCLFCVISTKTGCGSQKIYQFFHGLQALNGEVPREQFHLHGTLLIHHLSELAHLGLVQM